MTSTHGSRSTLGAWLSHTVLLLLSPVTTAFGDGFTPEEARSRMVLPPGFHAEVFASEPMIRQPLSVNFDARGRAWVIEYLQYPNPAGLKPVAVDQYLRTEYDRVPEPPPHGPRGADRIKILEDTDGDGRADKETIFVEGLNLASGLAVGHGGVFIAQAPYLLFYADRDQDDRPDGNPEVLLKGFGLQDAHSTVNSLIWGPDGWLYGTQGSTVTARIRGIEFQQGIWRFHPKTRAFELFAEGGGNTWGLDFDLAGNAFGSSNGGFITFHMVQGGNYWKGFAKHGPLHNPNAFGYFDAIAYEGSKVGGHVTPGGIIYKADAYPEAFRGAFIGGNLLSNAVYWHSLSRRGSTFGGHHSGTLIDSRDRWFRPIDLQVGPDGCVYVVDWYDKRASHLDPRDNWDRTNGRIYRVVYGERKKIAPFDLARLPSDELIAMRTSTNDWYAATARRLLAERHDASLIPRLNRLLAEDRDPTVALRDLWALYLCGGLDESTALGLLEHPVADVRRWTVRLLGDEHRMNPSLLASLVQLAENDTDPGVRGQLAASCQRWSPREALSILARLMERDVDRNDPHIPLMIWWACEKAMQSDTEAVVELLSRPEVQRHPITRDTLLERVARVLASRRRSGDFESAARLLSAAQERDAAAAVITGLDRGLEGSRGVADAPQLRDTLARRRTDGEPSVALVRLGARLGTPTGIDAAIQRLTDSRRTISERTAMAELCGQLALPSALMPLLALVERPNDLNLARAAIASIGGYDSPSIAPSLIEKYNRVDPSNRDRILALLCSRPAWATTLLDAMKQKTIDPRELRPAHVLQIVQLNDPKLRLQVEAVWGRVPGPGSPEKTRRIAEVRGFLPEGDKGDARRGQAVFKEQCAICHKLFGDGETIGPELTGSERGSLDFLLTSLVDPSALIRKEYQAQTVALDDGRVLNGLVAEESAQALTLIDSNRQKLVIPKSKIEAIKPSEISLMPEGILDKLPENQVRDLFRYLQSAGPPAAR
ncbi:MAG: PVC-type heme-binding CxxCH protein [Isosphaeraceae bacterium]